VEDYIDMAAKKTAALFAVSTCLGAYLGSEDSKLVDLFHLFGRELGMVFQIHDDILGIWGAEDTVGKSAGDICQRKKTLPVAYGLQNSEGAARKSLGKFYSQKSIRGEAIKEVTKILDKLGARNYAESVAEQYYYRALAHLRATRLDTSSVAPLKEAASFLSKRDF